MIAEHARPGSATHRYVIRPNRSLTWFQAAAFYGVCILVSLAIGMLFHMRGLPLVLPFSGLEMLVLGVALAASMLRGSRQEVISFDARRVVVEKGRRRPRERHEFDRCWAAVSLHTPRTWHPSRLTLRSHGREVEIGAFLTDAERRCLARALSERLRCADQGRPGGAALNNDNSQARRAQDHG